MSAEPRQHSDYSPRQTDAARRVLVDLGQTLAAFHDCLVVIGGWVPDLLLTGAAEPHGGSIDVDPAPDARKLGDGRYAELLRVLLATGRYRPGRKAFQLLVDVDLGDGGKPVEVEVEFLAPKEVKLKKNKPKLLEGFRVLQAEGCGAAFSAPEQVEVTGRMVRGSQNKVTLRVASLPDFLVMKAHAIGGRDKPKDSYDLCYCLDHFPGGIGQLASVWRGRALEPDVRKAVVLLREKFSTVDAFGPGQVVEFLALDNGEAAAMQARRAFELVQSLLRELS